MLVKICDFEAIFSYFEEWVKPAKFRNTEIQSLFL